MLHRSHFLPRTFRNSSQTLPQTRPQSHGDLIDQMFDMSFPWKMLRAFNGRDYDETFGLMPRLDIASHDNAYICTVELPGVASDNVKIAVKDNILTLSGEKKEEVREEATKHVTERVYGSFSREITLPDDIDSDQITAAQKDGVLTITIPRVASKKSVKSIEIQKG